MIRVATLRSHLGQRSVPYTFPCTALLTLHSRCGDKTPIVRPLQQYVNFKRWMQSSFTSGKVENQIPETHEIPPDVHDISLLHAFWVAWRGLAQRRSSRHETTCYIQNYNEWLMGDPDPRANCRISDPHY